MLLLNPVILSVLVLAALSLARINVIFALLAAAAVAGLSAGLPIEETFKTLIAGMGGQAETSLSYLLLGIFAVIIARTGITELLIQSVLPKMKGKHTVIVFTIAAFACLSQNVIPVHIAFIPILIPPLLAIFNHLKIDRRAVATALTFGLKAPYILIPAGFGLIFQGIVQEEMTKNGMAIELSQIPSAMLIPVGGMVLGLIIAVLFTYRKPRTYDSSVTFAASNEAAAAAEQAKKAWTWQHTLTIVAIVVVVALQFKYESLVISALGGILTLFFTRVVKWTDGDGLVQDGIKLMGVIAFVMLIASGYGHILRETGATDELVKAASEWLGGSQLLGASIMLAVGLLVTMGIGTSFGTIPILATVFVPLCAALGFSPLATAALIGTAGAIGDAGSPASDSTLGPTSGLNADGQHHHIWDTCVPTFIHFNIPLFIFGIVAAMVL